ncbi:MAG: L-ribulose-5-phosphate 4-epimerase AraD [Candidatus Hydrogenedentes bacterium]|nr:L-ribulose-5-phosphate 4-epimerase AraD [Candidatus Hydrogenedentota bacterium]
MYEKLRMRVCAVNLALKDRGLVFQTWGNASAVDREHKVVAIKPSGVDYTCMTPEHISVVDMDGNRVAGDLKPSVDIATHLALYAEFSDIGGVIHTHSHYATCFAQARSEIPCLGTTHADYFHGTIPLTALPSPEQVCSDYEWNMGAIIINCFHNRNPLNCPAALVAGHGPFTWGETVEDALENACVLEEVARMATHTFAVNGNAAPLEPYLLDKHFLRKHGKSSYYGQE